MFVGKRRHLLLLGTMAFMVVAAGFARAEIRDEAGMFSPEEKQRAGNEIERIATRWHVDVAVETFPSMPVELKGQVRDSKEDRQLMAQWAAERAKLIGADGVYVLICREPLRVQVLAGPAAVEHGLSSGRADRLGRQVRRTLGKSHNDAALEYAVIDIGNDFQARESGERWLWLVGVVGAGIGFWLVLMFIRSRMKQPPALVPEIVPSYAERTPANINLHVKPAEKPWNSAH
jgi:hypothetical protein